MGHPTGVCVLAAGSPKTNGAFDFSVWLLKEFYQDQRREPTAYRANWPRTSLLDHKLAA